MKKRIIALSFIASSLISGCGMLPYKESFSCEKGKENGICGSVSEVYDLSTDMEEFRKRANKDYAKEVEKKEQNKSVANEVQSFKNQKLQEMVEAVEIRKIQNETPTIFRYYLDEKEASEKMGYARISEDDKESKKIKKDKNANKQSNHHKKKTTKSSNSKNNNAKVVKNNIPLETNATQTKEGIIIYDDNQSKELNQSGALDFNSLNACKANSNETIRQINGFVTVCVYSANIRIEAHCKAPVLRVAKRGERLEALYAKGGWILLKDGTYIHESIVTKE